MSLVSALLATFGLDASNFHSEMDRVRTHGHEGSRDLSSAFGEAISEKLGQFGSLAFAEEAIRRTVEWGEKTMVLSERLGMTTDQVQKWDFALKLNGSTMEEAAGFFEKLATAQMKVVHGEKGADNLAAAFKRLGVSIDDLKEKRVQEITEQIARALQQGDVEQLKGDLRLVGGKSAGAMVPTLLNIEDKEKAPLASEETIAELHDMAREAKTFVAAMTATFGEVVATVHRNIFATTSMLVAFGEGLIKFWKELFSLVAHPQQLLNLSLKDNPLTKAAKEAFSTFDDAMQGKMQKEREEIEKTHRAQEFGGPGEGADPNSAAEVKQAREIAALKEQAMRVSMATALAEMNAHERVLKLQEAINYLKQESQIAGSKGNGKEQAQIDLEVAKMEADLVRAKKEQSREEEKAAKEEERRRKQEQREHRYHAPEVNELQKIGAYVSPMELSLNNHAAKSAEHLGAIRKHLEGAERHSRRVKF